MKWFCTKKAITEDFPWNHVCSGWKEIQKRKNNKNQKCDQLDQQLRSKTTINPGVIIFTFSFTSNFFLIFVGVFQHKEKFYFLSIGWYSSLLYFTWFFEILPKIWGCQCLKLVSG